MLSPIFYTDGYKTSHHRMYPKGTEMIYSNLTPRSSRIPGVDKVVFFGLQYFVKEYLIRRFNDDFFLRRGNKVLKEYTRRMDNYLGKDSVPVDHLSKLHDLGYLPLEIKALPEGSLCPLRVPLLTIKNTLPDFFWLPNFIETILSDTVWMPITSATIARQYRLLLNKYARLTSDIPGFVPYQAHDFSMRGHSSLESAMASGAGHLLSFVGTDTVPAIDFLEMYYGADSDKEIIGQSVTATEHSIMCVDGLAGEYATYERLLTEIYPNGILSIVSDTYNLWNVLTDYLPRLYNKIMARNGKLVIRPDSGDPVKIICGNPDGTTEAERKGVIQLLWDIFGGTVNSKGYRQLDQHVGAIYGDSITLTRAEEICQQLKDNGFASTNVVLGVGSYTYQYVTRDTFGLAFKATAAVVNGTPVEIWKDPFTDDGIKRSAKGLLMVYPAMDKYEDGKFKVGDYKLFEQVSAEQERTGCLRTVFKDGILKEDFTLSGIRERLLSYD